MDPVQQAVSSKNKLSLENHTPSPVNEDDNHFSDVFHSSAHKEA